MSRLKAKIQDKTEIYQQSCQQRKIDQNSDDSSDTKVTQEKQWKNCGSKLDPGFKGWGPKSGGKIWAEEFWD